MIDPAEQTRRFRARKAMLSPAELATWKAQRADRVSQARALRLETDALLEFAHQQGGDPAILGPILEQVAAKSVAFAGIIDLLALRPARQPLDGAPGIGPGSFFERWLLCGSAGMPL